MRLFGYSEEELAGKPFTTLMAENERAAFSMAAASLETRETVIATRSGQTIPVSLSGAPIAAEDPQFQGTIFVVRNITDRKRAERRIRYLARYDALTKVPNRMQFQHMLQQAIARARRNDRGIVLLYLDMDRFKEINDTFGHAAGDRTLEVLSERLTHILPKEAVVGRLAGDEFGLFIEGFAEEQNEQTEAANLARMVLAEVCKAYYVDQQEVFLTASVGIAFCPKDAENVIDLIRNADAAMYHSKQNGGNSFAFYSPDMNAAAVERLMLKSKLRRALERDELVMFYQPKVDLRDGRIIGAEALLRWRLPGHGDISPSQFIPLAEENNLILGIGEWVLNRVCADYRRWTERIANPGRVSINLSLKQLRQASFISRCRSVFRRHEVSPTCFELEITETTLMADPKRTIKLLDELYAMGLHLSIDDFGTGYSSLSALQQFPIGTLKIDQSFVRDCRDQLRRRDDRAHDHRHGQGARSRGGRRGRRERGAIQLPAQPRLSLRAGPAVRRRHELGRIPRAGARPEERPRQGQPAVRLMPLLGLRLISLTRLQRVTCGSGFSLTASPRTIPVMLTFSSLVPPPRHAAADLRRVLHDLSRREGRHRRRQRLRQVEPAGAGARRAAARRRQLRHAVATGRRACRAGAGRDRAAAIEFVMDGDAELRATEAAIADAEAKDAGAALGELHARYAALGGYDARSRAGRLMHGLGFSSADETRPVTAFSGGWRMRLNLAQALMCRSDLLLLDEPTNHLDLDAVLWLEDWLRDYPGTLLMIAHDREFLDRASNRIVHIEQRRRAAVQRQLLRVRRAARRAARAAAIAVRAPAARDQAHDELRRALPRQGQQGTPGAEPHQGAGAHGAHRAGARRFAVRVRVPARRRSCRGRCWRWRTSRRATASASCSQSLNMTIVPGARIALLGRNGAGKSTLMKLLAGELEARSGKRTEARDLRIGYFAQHQLEQLDVDESPLEHLRRHGGEAAAKSTEQELRIPRRLRLQRRPRVRAGRAVLRRREGAPGAGAGQLPRPNLLLLDEPTNHLDLEMRQALAVALQDYEGAVVLVSHDRHLLRAVADELILVDAGRADAIRRRPGGLCPLVLALLRRRGAGRARCGEAGRGTEKTAQARGSRAPQSPQPAARRGRALRGAHRGAGAQAAGDRSGSSRSRTSTASRQSSACRN